MTKQKYCFLGDSITEWVYVQSGKRHFNVIRNCADIWSAQLIDLYRESGLFPPKRRKCANLFLQRQN